MIGGAGFPALEGAPFHFLGSTGGKPGVVANHLFFRAAALRAISAHFIFCSGWGFTVWDFTLWKSGDNLFMIEDGLYLTLWCC